MLKATPHTPALTHADVKTAVLPVCGTEDQEDVREWMSTGKPASKKEEAAEGDY